MTPAATLPCSPATSGSTPRAGHSLTPFGLSRELPKSSFLPPLPHLPFPIWLVQLLKQRSGFPLCRIWPKSEICCCKRWCKSHFGRASGIVRPVSGCAGAAQGELVGRTVPVSAGLPCFAKSAPSFASGGSHQEQTCIVCCILFAPRLVSLPGWGGWSCAGSSAVSAPCARLPRHPRSVAWDKGFPLRRHGNSDIVICPSEISSVCAWHTSQSLGGRRWVSPSVLNLSRKRVPLQDFPFQS